MMQTNTQYMSDPARAERIVRRFMNLTLREMKQMQTRDYTNYLTYKLILTEELSPKKLLDISYPELACLIYNMGGNPRYDGYNHDSQAQQLAYYQCLASILRDGQKRSIPVRLFMALPLHAFYTALDSICGAEHPSLQAYRAYYNYKDSYTVGDLLNEKIRVLNKPWQPIMPLASYEDVIKNAYRDLGGLLVDSFLTGLLPQLCMEDIRNKYSALHKEERHVPTMCYSADEISRLPL
ncbi:MAG: hypothetical protein HFG70_09230 [Hungatella sp.]|jgi:hypothetical protein|nr:hypothetical protein [Hungatella sp.]